MKTLEGTREAALQHLSFLEVSATHQRICEEKSDAGRIVQYVNTILIYHLGIPVLFLLTCLKSARRARERYKKEDEEWARELAEQNEQLSGLEQRVQGITEVVERRERRKEQAVERRKAAKARGGSSSRKYSRGGSSK